MKGKQILVYAYVCADIIHKGHIEHLKNAKAIGDKLIVGVLTDEAVMEKKPKPTLHFEERADIVKSLECVDVVVAQETYSPVENALCLNVDILAESVPHEHVTPSFLKEMEETMKIRVVTFPYYPGHSSSGIKEKIRRESDKR